MFSPKVGALVDIDIAICEECGGAVQVAAPAGAILSGSASTGNANDLFAFRIFLLWDFAVLSIFGRITMHWTEKIAGRKQMHTG